MVVFIWCRTHLDYLAFGRLRIRFCVQRVQFVIIVAHLLFSILMIFPFRLVNVVYVIPYTSLFFINMAVFLRFHVMFYWLFFHGWFCRHVLAGSKRHSLHAVELSQRSGKPCANCVDPSGPQQWEPDYRFWASRSCGPAGWLAMLLKKAGDVETNPGPTTIRKQVWICNICHRQIQVRKHISVRCNSIEHWVHLRCAGIRLA